MPVATLNGGVLQIDKASELGPAPSRPAINIVFNGGELYNNGNNDMVTLGVNREIYLASGGGYIQPGWATTATLRRLYHQQPDFGSGGLGVAWDDGILVLNPPANAPNTTRARPRSVRLRKPLLEQQGRKSHRATR